MDLKKINWLHVLVTVAVSVVISVVIMHYTHIVDSTGKDTGHKLKLQK